VTSCREDEDLEYEADDSEDVEQTEQEQQEPLTQEALQEEIVAEHFWQRRLSPYLSCK